ncbi:MAG TPA: helix-turn-helix transcriptional regulator [Micropruina sp.]|jgi:transcriptional regulator with XRE-family HTH domain|nr:helix-turn-helix transcriptional regulator [Micropruina sp.]
MNATVADRVRQRIAAQGRTQSDVASSVGLSDSQLSKSISGARQFSAVEVASLASALGVSMHWLVTGEEDPLGWRLAARHTFDPATGRYGADFLGEDKAILQDVALLYRQAHHR